MAYGYEKILVEHAVAGVPTLPATVLRLPGVYGPGDRQHRVGEYLRQMDGGHFAIVLDRAKASWRWTRGYVEDIADAIGLAASDRRAAGRTYNVGEERAPTESEWVLGIGRAAGWDGEVRVAAREELPPEAVEPYDFGHDLVSDTRRIRTELGYRERTDQSEGLRQSVLWERNVGVS